ncbi:hypothetical protein BEWA_007330 [Theileria equi strain WA]|uniref:Uncharacterized protein n=1 Tax=Theileria equi strain WA TaxID=1537102 RepID=L0B2I1_THEEQ|nr:hypothetical protein BEWA_007330 [Theileria equi strain WA]AFZ81324.1 hypothetical protein BEWA_007330 [Theileria equi strain WA]|eukprot:XP_004830990.1 hypothetical protein BEWA_007330 [Theileria equi strain WA]
MFQYLRFMVCLSNSVRFSGSLGLATRYPLGEPLAKFRALVKKQSQCTRVYQGWPPATRIDVQNELKPLGRRLFVMNRLLEDGKTLEPTLVFCCGIKPMLMLSKQEFEALIKHLPWIKMQFKEFYKLL